MKIDVLCIGHAAYDLSLFVDSFPAENSKCQTEDFLESCGGPAANAAYLISKWNCSSVFAGLVGDDEYGQRIEASLRSVGTDVTLLERRPEHLTPVSMILVNNANGSRTIVNRSLPHAEFIVDVEAMMRFSPHVLLFDGHALKASLVAMEAFPNAISILDAGSWRQGTATLASRVDILAASERFALQCSQLDSLRTDELRRICVNRMRERYVNSIVVTLGECGYIVDDGSGFNHESAFPVEAIDTTAAGDIFHGALAYAVAESMPLMQSLRFASMTAALSVQQRGGRSSIPDLSQVEQALQRS